MAELNSLAAHLADCHFFPSLSDLQPIIPHEAVKGKWNERGREDTPRPPEEGKAPSTFQRRFAGKWGQGYNAKAMKETELLGRRIHYFRATTSTQDEARRLAEAGAPEGTVVLAEEQTAGRGRMGRAWLSPPGSSILMSVIFRPYILPRQAHRLTMIASISVAEAIENLTPLRVTIKWPNDILIAGKKAGGILTEIQASGDRILYAIVGIGLNVNIHIPNSPLAPLAPFATSLSDELGYEFPRFVLLQEILSRMEENYRALRGGEDFRERWLSRLYPLGQEVSVVTPAGLLEGVAMGVNEDGALLLATPDGEIITIWAGDVSLRKEVKHEQEDNP